jgi:endonuclease/exonuclease/phosphatase (EEP) superfamily protein YafD
VRVLGWVTVAILAALALVSLGPAVVGLSETTPVLQVIAMRGLLAVLLLGGGALLLAAALALRLNRRWAAGAVRSAAAPVLVLGIVVVLVGVGHGGVLLERGTDREALGVTPDGAVDILTLNTLGSAGGAEPVAALIDEVGPDVVALQETPAADAERVVQLLEGSYQLFTATTGPQPVQATALLVAASMGRYQQATAPGTSFGGVWAQPAEGDGPQLFSVHVVPPIPGKVQTWRQELAVLTALCERIPGVVIAGDLNATVDHAAVRDSECVDGASDTGGVGTWPADRPALLGTPIDHVLADADRWRPTASQVLDAPGDGDHRAVLVRLVPSG